MIANDVFVGKENDLSVDDAAGHGTAAAQLIAGSSLGEWPGGVAPEATVVSARLVPDVLPEGDSINVQDIFGKDVSGLTAAFNEFAANDVHLINLPWSGDFYWTKSLAGSLVAAFYGALDTYPEYRLLVVAAGDGGYELTGASARLAALPLTYNWFQDAWLAVAAVDAGHPDRLASYSNACGDAMKFCMVAPGDVSFTIFNSEVEAPVVGHGASTGYASALVTGAAAQVWEVFSYFDPWMVKMTLLSTATDLGAPGADPIFGAGLLNVEKALHGPASTDFGNLQANVPQGQESVWSNDISGPGEVQMTGDGTLYLNGHNTNAGGTVVVGNGTVVVNGSIENSTVASGRLQLVGGGRINGDVYNDSIVSLMDGSYIGGDFHNSGYGILEYQSTEGESPIIKGNLIMSGAYSGDNFIRTRVGALPLEVGGYVNLAVSYGSNPRLMVYGPLDGYVLQNRQVIMHADGGIVGQFSFLSFPDKGPLYSFSKSTLSYDANNIYLDIVRTDVAATAASFSGITPAALVSAQRIEATFDGIDAGGGASPGFLAGAGRIQSSANEAIARASLQSLSGEMHARADATTFDNIDASRRAVSTSFSARAAGSALRGGWSAQLDGIGNGNFSSNGWMTGTDVGVGANRVLGFAFGESNSTGYQTTGRDRAQERQSQAQVYLGRGYGKAYAMGQLGVGQYQRQLRRDIQLGEDHEWVATEYADDFFTANLEAGYSFGKFTPYASVDYMRLARGGFSEAGGSGFGLKTSAGSAEWVRAIAGLRAERHWRRFGMHGFAEWQQSLVEDGLYAKASFVGADAWVPLYGEGLYASGGLFGIGGDATLSKHVSLTFGYDQRFGARNNERQWTTRLRYGF